jgi:hypothetical protein
MRRWEKIIGIFGIKKFETYGISSFILIMD